jgi:DNA-binding response OmpR family regulator
MVSVLVVEDDADIRSLLGIALEADGHEPIFAEDGAAGLREFYEHRPDVVILDIGLPGRDGWTVLERIRELSDTPILMLTARGQERDKVRALNSGADDYVTKPFSRAELMARVKAILRRPTEESQAPSIHHGSLVIDLEAREVRIDDIAVALTPQEFRLLVALARRPNRTQPLAQLLDHAWDDPFAVNADRVKYAVMRLRRKLTDAAHGDFDPIATVRGIGYRFELAD